MRFHAIGPRDWPYLLPARSRVIDRSDLDFYAGHHANVRLRRVVEFVLGRILRESQRRLAQAGRGLSDWVGAGLWRLQKQELQRKKKRRV